VPGGGGGAASGTTSAVYADDPSIGSTDDVIEVYLGKRITLPAYNVGKRDRIAIINAGNSASSIKACQTPSLVRGVALADDGATGTYAQRFVLSGHTSNAAFAKTMTFSAWVRAASDGATSRCLFSIIDGTKYFRVITAGNYSGATVGDYLALQSYDGTRLVLDVRFPWTRGVLHHVVASVNVGVSPPVAKCAIDGVAVAALAGSTMLNYPLLGGNIMGVPRIGSGIAANSIQEWNGSIAQLAFWNVFVTVALEENIRLFYNDGPVDFGANGFALGASPGTLPLVYFNAEPTTGYQVVNAGTMGGSGGGSLGGGTFTDATPPASLASYALAYGGADAPLLEQIDGFPAGYTLPVGQEARFIRRASKGVWGVF
jgi:concanavalin A-like lectin/glucanase superfamily protein